MKLQVKKLNEEAILPKRNHDDDAALDIYSNEEKTIPKGSRKTISTGIAMAFPKGYVCFIKDRSGLAAKHGITTMAGVIDAGYRGEIKVVLLNTSKEDYKIMKGDRIAQAVLLPIPEIEVKEAQELPESQRKDKGFGSSGK